MPPAAVTGRTSGGGHRPQQLDGYNGYAGPGLHIRPVS